MMTDTPPKRVRKSSRVLEQDVVVVPTPPPVPVPLNLTYAAYDGIGLTIALSFDRAIDILNLDVSRVQVNDGVFTHSVYRGNGVANLIDANTVQFGLAQIDVSQGDTVLVSAFDDNNIVAADDGVHWLGVSDYPAN